MIEETATVVRIDGEFAWVETERGTACGACSANKGCGTATLDRAFGARRNRVRTFNQAGAELGDSVVIGLQEDALVRSSFAVYLTPLAGIIGGGAIGEQLANYSASSNPQLLTLVFAAAGLVAALAWVRRFSRRVARDPRYQPVVLRRSPASGVHYAPLPHIATHD